MYSAWAGQTALDRLPGNDPDPLNSIFTRKLVPLMRQKGLQLRDLAAEVRDQVHALAATVPHPQTPAYYDGVLGKFCLAGCGAERPQVAAAVPAAEPRQAAAPPAQEARSRQQVTAAAPVPIAARPVEEAPKPEKPKDNVVAAVEPAQTAPKPAATVKPVEAAASKTYEDKAQRLTRTFAAGSSWNPFSSGHTGWINSVAFSHDWRHALSGSDDYNVKLWDVTTGEVVRTFTGHTGHVHSVAISPDDRTALSGGDDGIRLWDIATGKNLLTIAGFAKALDRTDGSFARTYAVAFSPDGHTAVSGGDDNVMRLWELSSGKELKHFVGHTYYIASVAFSPDGRLALSGSGDTGDSAVRIWDVSNGKLLRRFTASYGAGGVSVAFSPDGKTGLSVGNGLVPWTWDISSGKEIHGFDGHDNWVRKAVFSPDGRTMLSVSSDLTLKLWDIATGRELHSFTGHTGWVMSVAYSPDGRFALSGGQDKTLKLWDISEWTQAPAASAAK